MGPPSHKLPILYHSHTSRESYGSSMGMSLGISFDRDIPEWSLVSMPTEMGMKYVAAYLMAVGFLSHHRTLRCSHASLDCRDVFIENGHEKARRNAMRIRSVVSSA